MKAEEQQVVLEGKTDNPLDLKNQQHTAGAWGCEHVLCYISKRLPQIGT